MNEQFDRVAMHAVRRGCSKSSPTPRVCRCGQSVTVALFERGIRSTHAGAVARAVAEGFAHCLRRSVSRGRAAVSGRSARRNRPDAAFSDLGDPDRPLAQEMIDGGLRAVLTCVNPKHLDRSFAGRQFDRALLTTSPPGSTPAESAANSIPSPTTVRCLSPSQGRGRRGRRARWVRLCGRRVSNSIRVSIYPNRIVCLTVYRILTNRRPDRPCGGRIPRDTRRSPADRR